MQCLDLRRIVLTKMVVIVGYVLTVNKQLFIDTSQQIFKRQADFDKRIS